MSLAIFARSRPTSSLALRSPERLALLRSAFGNKLVLDVDADVAGNGFLAELEEILQPARNGACAVVLRYQNHGAEAEIALGDEWKVQPSGAVLEQLGRLAGTDRVHLHYRAAPSGARGGQGRGGGKGRPYETYNAKRRYAGA